MKVVHTRSIPNVDADRLRDSLAQLHEQFHTAAGLHTWDGGHGKKFAEKGIKLLAIRDELVRRREPLGLVCSR